MSANWSSTFERLADWVQQRMERFNVPGVSIGVAYQGETAVAAFGVTNVDHPLPVTTGTLFQIGSITKTFTGTAIMRLVEAGRLGLDDPVRAHLPGFRVTDEQASEKATVRHLLTHTGGWVGDFFHDTGAGEDALDRYVADMSRLEQLAPIGRVWSYNNAGFAVAGRIVEVVTGQSYEQALQELVLDPLGLEHCYLRPESVMTMRYVAGHRAGEERDEVALPWAVPRSVYPVGGLICEAGELLRYARFHMGDGRAENGQRLLRPESLRLMASPQVAIGGAHEAMGLTWFINHADGVANLSHGGGTKGQISRLLLVPERQFALVVLTNSDDGDRITVPAGRWALEHFLGLADPLPEPVSLPPEQLSPYVGRYSRPYSDIDLTLEDGRLILSLTPRGGFPTEDTPPEPAPPPMECAFYEKDGLIVLDGDYKDARGEFIRLADDSVGWLRFSGRLHKRTRIPDND